MKESADVKANVMNVLEVELGKAYIKNSTQKTLNSDNQPLPDDSCDSFESDMKEKIEDLMDKNKPEAKPQEKTYIGSGKPVGTFELYFKFASKSDKIFILLAIIGSLGSGLSMPLFSVLFGGKIFF
jgi:hypothetical protein